MYRPVVTLLAAALSFAGGWLVLHLVSLGSDGGRNPATDATVSLESVFAPNAPSASSQAAAPSQEDELPSRRDSAYVETLEEMATTNAYAAFELSEIVRRCLFLERATPDIVTDLASERAARAMVSEERLADEIERTHGVDLKEGTVEDAVRRAEKEIDSMLAVRRHCAELEDGDERSWFDWMEHAARLGHPESQISYWRSALYGRADIALYPRRKALAMEFLSAAMRRGNPEALRALSQIHREGLVGPPNGLLAHAFLVAYSMTPGRSYIERALLEVSLGRDAAVLGLTADQQERAASLGEQIAERCCS